MEEAGDEPLFCERAAGIDIGKQVVSVTIRIPSDPRKGGRQQETREFGTTRRQLLELADWLRCHGVERAGMEAPSDYVRCDGAWVQVGGAAGGRFRP
jgi:transposase